MKFNALMIFLFAVCTAFAQSTTDNTQEEADIHAMALSDGQVIKLRWAIFDEDLWALARTHGVQVSRYEVSRDSTAFTFDERESSKRILIDHYKPLSESQWLSQFSNNEDADAARQLLYSDDFEVEITGPPTLADAFENARLKENQLTFSLLIANNDFDVAEGLALAYTDDSAETDYRYEYRIGVYTSDTTLSHEVGSAIMGLDDNIALPPPGGLRCQAMDSASVISWDTEGLEAYYTSYNIERSEDGVLFQACNDRPYIWTAEEGYEETTVFYKDSLADNETTYYYRIVGCTPFGVLGQPSDTVMVQGRPDPLSLQPLIDSTAVVNDELWMTWASMPASVEDRLLGFDIYRSDNVYGPFERVNGDTLRVEDRNYTDTQPLPGAYYRLRAYDVHGYVYESIPQFVQMPDAEPPATPSNLQGFVDNHGVVVVTWDENTEADLLGYRVLFSDRRDSAYRQQTSVELLTNRFEMSVDNDVLLDSIFYKVIAVDRRKNYSPPSMPLALARPDVVPPAAPVLFRADPTPEGVHLEWRLSESEDLDRHELQRKPLNRPGWETLMTIGATSADSTHVDASAEQMVYRYRLVAIDDQQNQSSSQILDVRPFDSGIRGEIEALEISSFTIGGDKPLYGVDLSWSYPADHMLLDFQIYRSKRGSALRLYQTITLQEAAYRGSGSASSGGQGVAAPVDPVTHHWQWRDQDIKDRGRYIYQIVARYRDGASSAPSKVVAVRL